MMRLDARSQGPTRKLLGEKKLLIDKLDPRRKKSRTEIDEPSRAIPKTDTAELRREKLLTDIDAPK